MASNVILVRKALKDASKLLTASGEPTSDEIIAHVKKVSPETIRAARSELLEIAMKRLLADASPSASKKAWVQGPDLFGEVMGLEDVITVKADDGKMRRMKRSNARLGNLLLKYKPRNTNLEQGAEKGAAFIKALIAKCGDEGMTLEQALYSVRLGSANEASG